MTAHQESILGHEIHNREQYISLCAAAAYLLSQHRRRTVARIAATVQP